VVLAVGETPVASGPQLRELVDAHRAEVFHLRVSRGGLEQEIHITPDKPDAAVPTEKASRLGVDVAPGVVVAEVLSGTPAQRAGPARGDIITAANGTPIHSGLQLRELVLVSAPNQLVALRTRRAGQEKNFVVQLKENPVPTPGS